MYKFIIVNDQFISWNTKEVTMAKRYRLREDSDLYQRLLEIEATYERLKVRVETMGGITIVEDLKTGNSFRIGNRSDYESFPRSTEVPFYLISEDD